MERTPGFHRKPPTEELKTMFYSFMKQTLSCVQISSFHCLWYLREEQTAGSSLDASTEDLFYFFPPGNYQSICTGKNQTMLPYFWFLTHAEWRGAVQFGRVEQRKPHNFLVYVNNSFLTHRPSKCWNKEHWGQVLPVTWKKPAHDVHRPSAE